MEALKLLDTPLIVYDGMDDEEIDILSRQAWQRSQLLQSVLDGKASWEEYLELLLTHSIEPSEVLDVAEANLNWAVRRNLWIEL